MSKAAVRALKVFESLAGTGLRGKVTAGFFSGLLKMIHPRAKVIDDNLKLAYPESSEQWRKEIRRKVYENIAWTVTELLALQRDPSQVFKWVKNVHNMDFAESLLTSRKGVIFLSGHFGNWELLSGWYAQYSRSKRHCLHIVTQELHDPDMSAYVEEIRKRSGIELIPKNVSVQKYARMLKNGMHLALLNDIAGTGKMMVPFMGHDATNMPGPAVMSMLSGVPIVPVCIYRNAPFEHEIEFFPPVEVPGKDLSHDERMRQIILECNKAIEKFIRKRPDLWFWLHKRWRP
ncbi:MAG: lysophospholipid acyltransferase family protein [Synergistaceae bacterium]|nr:lysophospholipid acyltransferase family protein [Synergistaceae bacterium]